MIGVTLPMRDGTGAGGLIMALLPGKIQETGTAVDIDGQLSRVVSRNSQCFIAMEEDGTITNASDPSLKRYKITELGLSEKSLRDGYVDFGVIRDENCFVMTKRDENRIYYFAAEKRQMDAQIISTGLLAGGLYAIGAFLLILLLLKGYNQKFFISMVEWYDSEEGRRSWISPEEDKDGNEEFYDEDLSARISGVTERERAQNIIAWLKIRMKWYG